MWWFLRNYGLLLLGLALLVRVAVSLPSGEFLGKYGAVIQSDSPGKFWTLVVVNTLCGVGLIVWQVYLWSYP